MVSQRLKQRITVQEYSNCCSVVYALHPVHFHKADSLVKYTTEKLAKISTYGSLLGMEEL